MINLNQEFKENEFVYLIIPDATHYLDTINATLKHLINSKKMECIYVTVARPFDVVSKSLKEKGIDISKIRFVDLVSKHGSSDSCVFINPANLAGLEIALGKEVKIPENKLIFLDSLSSLLTNNDIKDVSKFMYSFVRKVRDWKANAVTISLAKEIEDETLDIFSQICDKTIRD